MNTKQLKMTACICMFYDHFDRIFPINQILAPLWDSLYNAGTYFSILYHKWIFSYT